MEGDSERWAIKIRRSECENEWEDNMGTKQGVEGGLGGRRRGEGIKE